MGHVLVAAPKIARFHLHEQVGRRLLRRGNRVTLLATDPVSWRCFDAHGLPARLLEHARVEDAAGFAIQELAARDARLERRFPPDLRRLRRLRNRLARRTTPLLRLFETEMPDAVVLTDGRSGTERLIDAVARHFGCSVLHLGDGLVPGTLQLDPDGVDGDGAAARRNAVFYRTIRGDRALCDAVLVGMLGDVDAPPVARRFVHPPDLLDTLACVTAARSPATLRAALRHLAAWRRESMQPLPTREPLLLGVPDEPFVAVLLQDRDDPRVLLDADDRAPSATELLDAVRRACAAIDPALRVVAIRPAGPLDASLDALRAQGVVFRSERSAAHQAAAAAAVVTLNHPRAIAGILAGTPVLHLGRSPYGVPGIATRTTLDTLRGDLAHAVVTRPQSTLRARFATHVLTADHVWCEPTAPDPNGLRGVVARIEDAVRRAVPAPEPDSYRSGPGWPIAHEG